MFTLIVRSFPLDEKKQAREIKMLQTALFDDHHFLGGKEDPEDGKVRVWGRKDWENLLGDQSVIGHIVADLPYTLFQEISISQTMGMEMTEERIFSSAYNYKDPDNGFEIVTTPNGLGRWHTRLTIFERAVRTGGGVSSHFHVLKKFEEVLTPLLEFYAIYKLASQVIALANDFQSGANPGGIKGAMKKAERIKLICRGGVTFTG